jgi:HEAT repeat protein
MYRCCVLILFLSIAGCSRSGGDADQPISHWLETLKSSDRNERKKAIRMLADKQEIDRNAISALIGTLNDKYPDVRYEGIVALEKLGPSAKEALPALKKVQTDPDKKLRARATEAARRIQNGKA